MAKPDRYDMEFDGVTRFTLVQALKAPKHMRPWWRLSWTYACGCKSRVEFGAPPWRALRAAADAVKTDVDVRREKHEGTRPWACPHARHVL